MLLYSRVRREFKYLIPKMDNETIETDFYELVLYFWWYIVNLKVKERLNIITCIRAECAQQSRELHLAHFLIISFVFQTEFPNNVDIDLDEILDIEDENQRKKFIRVSYLILNCIFRLFTMGWAMGVPIFQFILKMSFCLSHSTKHSINITKYGTNIYVSKINLKFNIKYKIYWSMV